MCAAARADFALAGMRLRAPRHEEAAAVLAVIVARDVADTGRADYTLRDVLADWALPSVDLERDVFVVEAADGTLVGWADVDSLARVAVHPDHERRGVGTLLRVAVEARQRERGFVPAQQVVAANAAGVEHLRRAGYERVGVFRRMVASLQAVPPLPAAAAAVRPLDLDSEGATVHALISDAFAPLPAHDVAPLADWRASVAARSEPAFRLVLDDGGLVGAAIGERWDDGVGYVRQLAVVPPARGRGHGRTLLLALLHAFRGAALTAAELSVGGANAPATGLYESAGMRPDYDIERWELRPRSSSR